MHTRRNTLKYLAGAALAAPAFATRAQSWPSRAIRVVVPYAPGGGTDLMVRVIEEPLGRLLAQPVVVDNKSGAAGSLGTRLVAQAAPDGYTLLVSNNGPSAILPLLQKEAGYDPVADFAPISTIARQPIVVITNPQAVPAKDLAGVIEWARKQSDGMACASSGVGSLGHLASELFASRAGIKLVTVPYRGQAPTVLAVLTGEVPIAFTSASEAMMQHVREGKINLVGIGSKEPFPLIPGGVPMSRTLPGYEVEVWHGVLAPAGTPDAVVDRLNAAIAKVLESPEIQQKFAEFSYATYTTTPREFAGMIAAEVEHWGSIIRERNIKGS